MSTPGYIQELERITYDESLICERIAEQRPFVTHIEHWPALHKWTPGYLGQSVGEKTISVVERVSGEGKSFTFQEWITLITTNLRWRETYAGYTYVLNRMYSRIHGIDEGYKRLFDDIEIPSFVSRERLHAINLWCTSGRYDNGNHFDSNACHNINIQIIGKKRIFLFDPDQCESTHLVPIMSELSPPFLPGGAAPYGDDTDLSDARAFQVTLTKGDMLYIPPLWMHWFRHDDEFQLNVNQWWFPEILKLSNASLDWAFATALVRAMYERDPDAGMEGAFKAIQGLSKETIEVLLDVEKQLIKVGATDPVEVVNFRMGEQNKPIGPDVLDITQSYK